MDIEKEQDAKKEYIDFLQRNQQFFDQNFIKDKTLKDIIYKPIQKMFLNFGKSMFLCLFVNDILSFIAENYAITQVDKTEFKKACKIIKNIRYLNLKIANEFHSLTKGF